MVNIRDVTKHQSENHPVQIQVFPAVVFQFLSQCSLERIPHFFLLEICPNRLGILLRPCKCGPEETDYLLVQFDVLQHLDGLVVIPQQRVQPQQAHQAEVAQHLVEGVPSVLPGHTLWVA